MKKRIIAFLAFAAFTVAGFAADKVIRKPVNDYHIKKLGVNKFVKNSDYRKVKNFSDFAAMAADKYAADIQLGLVQLDEAAMYESIIAYFKNNPQAAEGEIPYGSTMEWMFFRKNGLVRTMARPVWEGKDASGQPATIPAYLFDVYGEGQHYQMAVPKACLNLALIKKEPFVASCNMVIKKQYECATVGENITVDMSASEGLKEVKLSVSPEGATVTPAGDMLWTVVFPSAGEYTVNAEAISLANQAVNCQSEALTVVDPLELELAVDPACSVVRKPVTINTTVKGGDLTKLTIKNESGAVVLNQENPEDAVTFKTKEAGMYQVEAEAKGECNQVKNVISQLRFEKPILSPFYLIGEAGFMLAKGTYSSYFYPRFGAGVWLSDHMLSLELLPGAGLSLAGEAFHSFFMVDARLALHPGQAYLGAGVGLSSKVRDAEPGHDSGVWESDFDLSFAAGYYLTPEKNMAIIGEFRMPIGENIPIKYNHAIQLGFRYIFPINSGKNPCEQN